MKVMRERRNGKLIDAVRVMLPGYVFAESEMRASDWHRLHGLPGVLRILGADQPQPLPLDEIERLRWLDNGGAPWAISTASQTPEGVVITGGPLAVFEKEIIGIDRRQSRARLTASILGENKSIDLALVFEKEGIIDRQTVEPEG